MKHKKTIVAGRLERIKHARRIGVGILFQVKDDMRGRKDEATTSIAGTVEKNKQTSNATLRAGFALIDAAVPKSQLPTRAVDGNHRLSVFKTSRTSAPTAFRDIKL